MNSYSKIVKPNINDLISQNTNLVKKISWHLHGRVNSIIDINTKNSKRGRNSPEQEKKHIFFTHNFKSIIYFCYL